MRASTSAVVAGLALIAVAASCASGDDAGEASNENVPASSAGAAGTSSSGGTGGKSGELPDAGIFPEGGSAGGAAGAGGLAGAGGGPAGAPAGGSSGAGAGGSAASGAGGNAAGAAGSAGVGGAACTPQCGGKQCGADGCNGQCGSCAASQTCDAGVCKDVCQPSWKATLSGISPNRIVVDGGTLYVAGKKGNQGYLGAFESCTGNEVASQTTLVGASSSLISVQLSATHVFAAGDGGNVGLVVRAKRSTLQLESSDPLVGSSDGDEVWDAAPTPAGNLWMTGGAALKKAPSIWVIEGPIGQPACGFSPIPTSQGQGRAVAVGGGKVFLVGQRDQQGIVARYADENCAAANPCTCAPELAVPIMMGLATDVRHATYANGKLFIVGYGSDGANSTSFLARLDPTDLTIEATYKLDPSPTADSFLVVSVDAGMAYVGGLKGWQGDSTFQSATGQVLAIPSTFGAGTPPLWIHEPPGSHVVWGVSAQAGSVYVSMTAADGVLMKCAAAGCF